MDSKLIATNKKAFRDYAFEDSWECGIALIGAEVKSVRAGQVNFKDSFARVEAGEVKLYSLYIAPYQQASYMNEDPERVRTLLMHKKEIKKLYGKLTVKGLTLIPTKIYINKRGLVKVKIALGRGKKHFDKRETVKKRDTERSLKRQIHARNQ